MSFDPSDLGWLVPYLILAITGMLLVLAEAFYKGKDHTAPGRPHRRGLARLGGVGDRVVPAARRRGVSPRVRRHARRRSHELRADRAVWLHHRRNRDDLARAPTRARLEDRRVLRRDAAVDVGHGHARAGVEPRHRVPRHRDDVDRRLRDDRDAAPLAARQRGGDEVLPRRRVRDRVPDVRHGAALRRDRHARARRRCLRRSRARRTSASRSPARSCSSSRSASRSRRCRSTCGRPTRTTARRRRSPRSWPPRSSPPRSPR